MYAPTFPNIAVRVKKSHVGYTFVGSARINAVEARYSKISNISK